MVNAEKPIMKRRLIKNLVGLWLKQKNQMKKDKNAHKNKRNLSMGHAVKNEKYKK